MNNLNNNVYVIQVKIEFRLIFFTYRAARNFCGSLFLQIGDVFVFLRELIFAIRTDWFFLQRINFCDF